jgi:flavin-dependent dehydrogenase
MSEANGGRRLGQRLLIVGGSIAGLLAARALSPSFAEVVVVDRDTLPDAPAWRKGAAQSHHGHVLLAAGEAVLERFFPGLFVDLAGAGAATLDMSETSNWFHLGSWKRRFASGMRVRVQSRELLEHAIRQRVRALPNVRFSQGVVAGLDLRGGSPEVNIDGRKQVADFVIDASGRGARLPDWLVQNGHAAPRVERVAISVNYASARYVSAVPRDWDGLVIYPEPPAGKRGGYIFPMEDGSLLVNLLGWCGEAPAADDAGFLEYARSLPQPEIHAYLEHAERRGVFRSYRHGESRWHRYDALSDFPDSLAAVGDALCCFDPVYGQGMSAAALTAELLADCAARATSLGALAHGFRKAAPRVLEAPWKLAATEDWRYPSAGGGTFALRALQWYTAHVQWLTGTDDAVYRRFMRVINLLDPPTSLFHPSVVGKVAVSALRGPRRVLERPRV